MPDEVFPGLYGSIVLLILMLACPKGVYAQQTVNVDSLLLKAQKLAAQKEYAAAREQARQVLQLTPRYTDASLLIGRTYAWEESFDSARAVLVPLLQTATSKEEVLFVLSSVELWAGDPATSLQYAEEGLQNAPASAGLVMAKAQALRDLKRYKEASAFLQATRQKTPSDPRLADLQKQLEELSRVNRLSINYQFSTFDQDIPNWQLGTIQYTRNTARGTLAAKVNYVERFAQHALQAELEAWPRLNEKTYAYLNFGVSGTEIFPNYRAGAELYRLLPHQLEVSLGLRSLVFEHETVWLYTGQVGKYFNKYWASFRPFLQYQHNTWQGTGILQVRRYFRHSDEFISLSLSKGTTPSEQVALQEINRLDATRIGLEGQFRLKTKFLLGGILQYDREEYTENNARNRFTSGLSLQYKF